MRKDKSMNKKIIVGTLAGCIFGATVGYSASVVSLPHTFTAGTPIKASEVNANFSALSQEISNLKNITNFGKSTEFSESVLTPISATVGSTVTVGGKSFEMKQMTAIEDLVTGKKYTLNYPSNTGDFGQARVMVANCNARFYTELAIKVWYSSSFTSYVSLKGFPDSNGIPSNPTTYIYVSLSNNLCASIELERSADSGHTIVNAMIERANEIQRYIAVKQV